jgi:hypothetical protein
MAVRPGLVILYTCTEAIGVASLALQNSQRCTSRFWNVLFQRAMVQCLAESTTGPVSQAVSGGADVPHAGCGRR